MKHYICENCKIIYGHQQIYCPGCPSEMKVVDLSTAEVKAFLDQKWNGNEELEYLWNGRIFLSSSLLEKAFVAQLDDRYKAFCGDFTYATHRVLYMWNKKLRWLNFALEDSLSRMEFKEKILYRKLHSTVMQSWWPAFTFTGPDHTKPLLREKE